LHLPICLRIPPFEVTKKKLQKLRNDSEKRITKLIAIPQLNTEQIGEARKINAELRDTRYLLQNIEKNNIKVFNDAKAKNKTEIKDLIAIIEPTEEVIYAKIKAEDDRKEQEKKEKEEAENRRITAINQKIADAGIDFERMILTYTTAEQLAEFDEKLQAWEDDIDNLEEFAYEGNKLVEGDENKPGVKERRAEIVARVERAAEQAAEAERQAAEAERQAQVAATQAAENKRLEAERLQFEENKRRLKALAAVGYMYDGENFSMSGTVVYSENDINAMAIEAFDAIIEARKKAIAALEAVAAAAKAQQEAADKEAADKLAKQNELNEAYAFARQAIFNYTGEELPDVENATEELLSELETRLTELSAAAETADQEKETENIAVVDDPKEEITEQQKEVARFRYSAPIEKSPETIFKEGGAVICGIASKHIEAMKFELNKDLLMPQYKGIVENFYMQQDELLRKLATDLKQF